MSIKTLATIMGRQSWAMEQEPSSTCAYPTLGAAPYGIDHPTALLAGGIRASS